MSRGGDRGLLLTRKTILTILLVGVVVVLLLLSVLLSNLPKGGPTGNGSAEYFTDTVTKIVDGDTLYVGDVKIRLVLVDTPEVGENGFEEATHFAASLCPVGSNATVDQDDDQLYDQYGRMLAVVYCGGKNLNAELLEGGHAVILTQYCDESEFGDQEWAREYGC